jgi:hypothetical protein
VGVLGVDAAFEVALGRDLLAAREELAVKIGEAPGRQLAITGRGLPARGDLLDVVLGDGLEVVVAVELVDVVDADELSHFAAPRSTATT